MNSQERSLDKWYGEKLRVARVKAGLTQVQLAMRAGIPQERISRMERGKNSINLSDYIRAMKALNAEYLKGIFPGEGGELDILCKLLAFHAIEFQYSKNEIKFTDLQGPLIAYREGSAGEVIYLPCPQPDFYYGLRKDHNTVPEKSPPNPEAVSHQIRDFGQLPLPLGVWSEASVGPPYREDRSDLRS